MCIVAIDSHLRDGGICGRKGRNPFHGQWYKHMYIEVLLFSGKIINTLAKIRQRNNRPSLQYSNSLAKPQCSDDSKPSQPCWCKHCGGAGYSGDVGIDKGRSAGDISLTGGGTVDCAERSAAIPSEWGVQLHRFSEAGITGGHGARG